MNLGDGISVFDRIYRILQDYFIFYFHNFPDESDEKQSAFNGIIGDDGTLSLYFGYF